MKYRILIFIIIIISLGQILLSYIANTSCTHACPRTCAHACVSTHTHTYTHTHTPPSPPPYRLALFICDQPWPTAPLAFIAGSRVIEINTRATHPIFPRFLMFFAYKKIARPTWNANSWTGYAFSRYGQFETSPEKIELELRPAVCERRQTDRFKENYSIDGSVFYTVMRLWMATMAIWRRNKCYYYYVSTCSGAVSYTAIFNVLNFTAGCLPVTSVTEEDLANMKDYETPDPWHSVAKKVGTLHCIFSIYDLMMRIGTLLLRTGQCDLSSVVTVLPRLTSNSCCYCIGISFGLNKYDCNCEAKVNRCSVTHRYPIRPIAYSVI